MSRTDHVSVFAAAVNQFTAGGAVAQQLTSARSLRSEDSGDHRIILKNRVRYMCLGPLRGQKVTDWVLVITSHLSADIEIFGRRSIPATGHKKNYSRLSSFQFKKFKTI